jgi:hypothetical protein
LQCPLNILRTTSSRRSCTDAADGGEEEEEEKAEDAEEVNWMNSRQEEFKTRLTDIGITAIRNVALPLTSPPIAWKLPVIQIFYFQRSESNKQIN